MMTKTLRTSSLKVSCSVSYLALTSGKKINKKALAAKIKQELLPRIVRMMK